MSSSSTYNSLETITFKNKQERIQSPYSKLALKQLGLDEKKLYFQSKAEYINNHPDLSMASPQVQDNQYTKHEARRLDRIDKAKTMRNDLLNKSNTNSTRELYNSATNLTSILLQKEMDKIEQMKLHQIGEIRSVIDYEVYMQELRKRNDNRMRHLKEKEEEIRKKQLREQEEREKRCVLEEMEREKQAQQEERESFKKMLQKEEDERIRREEESQRKEKIEREALSKLLERRKLQEESQKKQEEIDIKNKSEQEQRLKEFEQKEEYRLKYIEQKKQEAYLRATQIEKHAKETYNIATLKNEEELNEKKNKIEGKYITIREYLKKYNEDLENKIKEQQEKKAMKEKVIIENTKKSEYQLIKRADECLLKQEIQHKSIENKEKKTNWEIFQKLRQRDARNEDWKERKRRNDSLFEIKRSKITLRQSESEEKVLVQKEREKQVTYDKIVELKMKKEVNSENLAQYEKIIHFHNMEKMKRYQMKLRKIKETEDERKEITVKKRTMENEIMRRKEMLLRKINRIVNSNNYTSQDDVFQKVLSKEQYSFSSKHNSNINNSTSRYGTRTRFASPNNSRIDSSIIRERRDGNEVNQTNVTIKLDNNPNSNYITQSPNQKTNRKINFNSNATPAYSPTLAKMIGK